MPARPRRLLVETVIVAALVLVCMSHSERDFRLNLQFEIYPGAIYLALLSWPAFLRGGDPAEDGPDVQLAAYSGPAYTMASGLKFTQRGGTDLSFGELAWKGQPFKPPIYYGLRAVLWPANGQQGVMVDFTHIKAMAVMERLVQQSGTCSAIRGAVKEGGVETNLCTHQLLGGPAWHLDSPRNNTTDAVTDIGGNSREK